MATSRARAGHARTKRTGVASRALAALAVVATAASTLVVSQAAVPQAAQAAQEPAATGIEVGAVRASMGTGIINASETDTTTSYPNNYIRYGITKAMSEPLVVKDTEVGELPKAGSTGIYPYIGVATALMSGAMVMTVVTTKRRKALA